MIDLHVHSTVSDGSYTPAGLAVLAKESGVEAFALTDHDSIAGTDEAAATVFQVFEQDTHAVAERIGVRFRITASEQSNRLAGEIHSF